MCPDPDPRQPGFEYVLPQNIMAVLRHLTCLQFPVPPNLRHYFFFAPSSARTSIRKRQGAGVVFCFTLGGHDEGQRMPTPCEDTLPGYALDLDNN